jgi:hypothetical protein
LQSHGRQTWHGGLHVGIMLMAVGVGRGSGSARYPKLCGPSLAVPADRRCQHAQASQPASGKTYWVAPWKWHSDTAVMVAGLGSETVGLTSGARRWRGTGSPAHAVSSP